MIFIPNDRSVLRMPEGLRLQTGLEAETLCVKRLRALKWLRARPVLVSPYRRRLLRVVS